MKFPNLPLPPKPVITRFGTWLEAADYYCANFDAVRSVVDSFDRNDSEAIKIAQETFASRETIIELVYIKTNFSLITRALTQIQAQGLELSDAIQIYETVDSKMCALGRKEFETKFRAVQARNVGLKTLHEIHDVLYKGKDTDNEYISNLTPGELAMFKFAPTTSCDVERTFSSYKMVFDIRRKSCTFENLKKHLIVYCNRKIVEEDE